MYTLVYDEMVASGVAKKLDKNVYFNINNEIVQGDDNQHTGTLLNILVTDPSYILFVNKTGSSTNMRKNKSGSSKVIAENDTTEQNKQ
jgi:hypothetical protein